MGNDRGRLLSMSSADREAEEARLATVAASERTLVAALAIVGAREGGNRSEGVTEPKEAENAPVAKAKPKPDKPAARNPRPKAKKKS